MPLEVESLSTKLGRPPFHDALANGMRLRCPNCKQGRLFAGLFQMKTECPVCRLGYFRESGYYLGAMFLNFIISAILIVAIYCLLLLVAPRITDISTNRRFFAWMAFAGIFSLALMRHSYSLWLSIDYWIGPWNAGVPPQG